MTLFLKTSFLAYSFAPDFNSLCVFYTGASCSTVASYVHHGRIGYSLGRHGYVIKERCIDTLQHLFIRSNVATNTVSVFLGVAHRKDRSRWKLDWLCLFVFLSCSCSRTIRPQVQGRLRTWSVPGETCHRSAS